MTYINLMLAWDMMAGLDGLKLKANQSFVQSQAIWLKLRGEPCKNETLLSQMGVGFKR